MTVPIHIGLDNKAVVDKARDIIDRARRIQRNGSFGQGTITASPFKKTVGAAKGRGSLEEHVGGGMG